MSYYTIALIIIKRHLVEWHAEKDKQYQIDHVAKYMMIHYEIYFLNES